MTPLQDAIALIVATAGLLLVASTSWSGTAQQQQRPSVSVRQLCEDDMARFCADATGAQRMKACMQGNAKQLRPACRSALESAGMLSK